MATITTQRTAKKWKVCKIVSVLLVIVGALAALTASAAADMSMAPGGVMFAGGIGLGIVGRFGAWMTNG